MIDMPKPLSGVLSAASAASLAELQGLPDTEPLLLDVEQVERIQRIGKRLFGVASCLFSRIGQVSEPSMHRSMAAIEAVFCAQSSAAIPVVVPDARQNSVLAKHRSVVGAPYLRFFASYPVLDTNRVAVGSLCLLDYNARTFSGEDSQFLADLALQLERELCLLARGAEQLDLVKKNKNLRRDSLMDPLLGSWNRAAIERLVTIELERCRINRQPLSLVLVGLDHFKQINDALGPAACDTALVKVASRIRSCVRPGDALGRYIGDQLLVVLPGASHIVAESAADRMRRGIMQAPDLVGDNTISLTISAGTVSTNLLPSATAEQLLQQVDRALSAAKTAGRNCVVAAKPVAS